MKQNNNNNNNSAKKVPVAAKVGASHNNKSRMSPQGVLSKKKFTSPIDVVFNSNNSSSNNSSNHHSSQYNYRRRNNATESSSTAIGNYMVTKTKYKRLPDHSNHQYHRQQQQQQPHRPNTGRKKELSPSRKQLGHVPPRRHVSHFEQYEHHNSSSSNYTSLKRQRRFYSSNNNNNQQQQQQSYSYKSSSTSTAVSSKFYEMKLPDVKRIYEKEKEMMDSSSQQSTSSVDAFPCWRKSSIEKGKSNVSDLKFNAMNDSSKKKPPSSKNGGAGKSIQDIIHHIRDAHTDHDNDDDADWNNSFYDDEMNQLTQYIQLHPHEIQLRNRFVSQLEEQIIQQLPSMGHTNNNNKLPSQPKYCHIFGSFASIPICTFQSDLDIALFNVGIEGNYKTTTSTSIETTSTSSYTTTAASVSEDQNKNYIDGHEVIIIDDDDDDDDNNGNEEKFHVDHDAEMNSTGIANKSKSTVATTTTKQQRKAMLVAKWKQALEQSSSTVATTAASTTTITSEDVINLDDDKVINIFHDSDFDTDSDNDSADPMTRYQPYENNNNDDDNDFSNERGRKRAYSDSTILSMNSQNDGTSTENTDKMTVSFFASKPPPSSSTSIGPQGHVRIKVVGVLATLCNKLRKKSVSRSMQIQNVTFIKTARVPIIKIQLLSGFNVDIAIGGYGTDTSLYAAQQMQLYPNMFVQVVVFLKVLLGQHNLDEPYSGGLGSYKLYILIADHIYRHQQWCSDIKNGCRDHCDRMGPFEILFTFLYRYGYGGSDMQDRQVLQYPTSTLHQHRPLVSAMDSTTSADLSNVYKLQDCITLFRLCFHRLYQQVISLQGQQGSTRRSSSSSILAHVICPFKLQSSRERILQQTKQFTSNSTSTATSSSTSSSTREDTAVPLQSITSNKTDGNNATRPSPTTSSKSKNLPDQDRTRDEILAGYERVFC